MQLQVPYLGLFLHGNNILTCDLNWLPQRTILYQFFRIAIENKGLLLLEIYNKTFRVVLISDKIIGNAVTTRTTTILILETNISISTFHFVNKQVYH